MEAAERLRVSRTSLEASNEKLESELEETRQRLRAALSKAAAVGPEGKASRATVVARSAKSAEHCKSIHTLNPRNLSQFRMLHDKQWNVFYWDVTRQTCTKFHIIVMKSLKI